MKTQSAKSTKSTALSRRGNSALIAAAMLGLLGAGASIASAGTYYWDTDGSGTPGFGTANGTWGTSTFWGTDPAGSGATANTTITNADDVNFGTALAGLGAGTVTGPASAQSFLNMTFGSASGAIVLSGGTLNLDTTTGSTITVNNAADTISTNLQGVGGKLIKAGSGTLTLSGAANNYSGSTTISAGKLQVASNVIASSSTIFIGNGATLETTGTGTFVLGANQAITGTGATGFATTVGVDKGVSMVGTNTISTSGTLTFTRLNVTGTTSNQITGGNIESGGTGSSQRGLVIGSGSNGTLTITNATFTSKGINTGNQFDIIGNGASNTGTLILGSGGSYVNTLNKLSLGNTNASGTLTINNGGSATISEIDFNAGTTGTATSAIVNLNNGGTLTVSKITVTAGTTRQFNFDGGTLKAGASSTTFMTGLTNAYVMSNGAKFDTNGKNITIGQALLDFTTPSGGGLTLNDTAVTKGTLTLSGSNTYTGATTVTAGTLQATKSGALPNFGTASKVSVANAATLALNYGGASDWSSTNVDNLLSANGAGFASGSTLALDTTNLSGSYATNITVANLGLTKLGANILTLSGNNSYTGATTVSAGVISVQNANALGTTAAGTTVANGAAIELQGGISYASEALAIDGGGVNGSGPGGSGAATNNGALRNVSGSNTWNGNITVGTQNVSRIGADTGSTLTIAGDVNLTGAAATSQTTLQGDGTIIVNGKISGTGQLSSSSTGNSGVRTLTNNANDYSSKTNLNGGRLRIGANGALGTSTVVFNGGTLSSDGSTARTIANALSVIGAIVLGNSTDNGKLTFTNASTLTTGARTWTANSDAEFQMNIDHSAGTMTKEGAGNLFLTGGGSLTRLDINNGTMAVSAGTYNLSNYLTVSTLASGPASYVQTGGTVNLNGAALGAYVGNAASSTSTFTVSGGAFNVNNSEGLIMRNNGTATMTVSGAGTLSSTGTGGLSFQKSGSTGTFNLGDGSTFSGGASINDGGTSGVFTASKVVRTAGTSTNNIFNFNGGTLKASAASFTFADNTNIAANVMAGGGIVDNGNFDITIGQNLLNGGGTDGGMVFKGSGKTTLTGASTYNGGTTVAAGILAVNGSLSSASNSVVVKNTATLQGIGTIAGAVTVQSGGTLAAGNSIESLGVGGLSLQTGSNFSVEIDRGAVAGSSADLSYLTAGTLSIANDTRLNITEIGTGTWALDTKLTLIAYTAGGDWTGGLFDYYVGNTLTINNLADGDTIYGIGGRDWVFNYDDTVEGQNYTGDTTTQNRFVTITAIPEPTATAFGLLALGGLLLRRRRD